MTYNRVFGVIYTVLGLLGLIPALYFPTYGTDAGRFWVLCILVLQTMCFTWSSVSRRWALASMLIETSVGPLRFNESCPRNKNRESTDYLF